MDFHRCNLDGKAHLWRCWTCNCSISLSDDGFEGFESSNTWEKRTEIMTLKSNTATVFNPSDPSRIVDSIRKTIMQSLQWNGPSAHHLLSIKYVRSPFSRWCLLCLNVIRYSQSARAFFPLLVKPYQLLLWVWCSALTQYFYLLRTTYLHQH